MAARPGENSLSASLARIERALASEPLEALIVPPRAKGHLLSGALFGVGGVAVVAASVAGFAWLAIPAGLVCAVGGLRLTNLFGSTDAQGARIGLGATVASDAQLEPGAIIEAGATVESKARIRSGAVVRMGATVREGALVDRDAVVGWGVDVREGAVIGEGARISAGADIREGAKIGAGAFIGWGADVREGAVVGEGARVGAGADVREGAGVPDAARVLPGGEVTSPSLERGVEPTAQDPRDERIDKICDRIESELSRASEAVRSFLGASAQSALRLRKVCHDLTARERALRAEASPDVLSRLADERRVLEAKVAAAPDERVRQSLLGAVAAIDGQLRHREQLAAVANRLEAEHARLTWILDGIATQFFHVRAAGAEASAAPIDESVRQLQDELEAIASALEEVGTAPPPASRVRS